MGWEVQLVVIALGFEGAQRFDPEVLSSEQRMSDLFFCHCHICNLFNYDHSEIVERMTWFSEVSIYRNCVDPLYVVSVFINPPVGLLALQFADVLLLVAPVAEGEIDGISPLASCSLSDFELLLPGLVSEEVGVHDMGTAFRIRPAPARRTSSLLHEFLPYHLVILDPGLPKDILEIPIAFEAE